MEARKKMGLETRKELVENVKVRYRKAIPSARKRILDEFVKSTGYHRKYAISLLKKRTTRIPPVDGKTDRKRKYNDEVRAALVLVWRAANEICTKRLIPFLPVFVQSLERSGHISISANARSLLLSLSAATADRLLKAERKNQSRGRSMTRPGSLLKKQIPIRTFSEWNDVAPGFFEGDLVAHCGESAHGTFLNTLTLTDICSGWTELLPLVRKSEAEVRIGLDEARQMLPFPMLGLDTDNGSEFINHALVDYCKAEQITFTRARPYKKNDQAHVEEKNGSIVRRLIGYDRYEGEQAYNALSALYKVTRQYVNFFQPSMKLLSKERDGAKVKKKYDAAKTPYQRLMVSNLSQEVKKTLEKQFLSLDPLAMLKQLEDLQKDFWQHAKKGRSATAAPVSLPERTVASSDMSQQSNATELLSPVSPDAKVEPLRQRPRNVRTPRKSAIFRVDRAQKAFLDNVWKELEQKLKADRMQRADNLLDAAQEIHPGKLTEHDLRILRRRIQLWHRQKMTPSSDEAASQTSAPTTAA
jgi:hypothetical protein